jgi:hypothetical protein
MESPSHSIPSVPSAVFPKRALAAVSPFVLFMTALPVFAGSDTAPCLTEIMARNLSTEVPNAASDTFRDWIEVHNPADTPVNLEGWHLTDDPGIPFKWPFPSVEIPANGYLLVMATGTGEPDGQGNLHTNFGLRASGGYIALTDPELNTVSEFDAEGTDYPAQPQDVSYGTITDGKVGFMANPTPGATNDPAEWIQVTDTKFSVNRGIFSEPLTVEITTATPDATIRYTLDHTEPTEDNGEVYSAPIQISDTTVLKARAFAEGLVPTNTDTNTYIFPDKVALQEKPEDYPTGWGGGRNRHDYEVDPEIALDDQYKERFQQGLRMLPVVSISMPVDDMFGTRGLYRRSTDRNLEIGGAAEYFRPDPKVDGVNIEDGWETRCGVKVQGGASRNKEASIKHSLSLRFREQYGLDWLDYPLFDAPEAVTRFNSIHLRAMYNNSWIHRDAGQRGRATMIRDQFMRDTLIEMGNPDAGHGHYCHLYLNGLYWGVYNIHERLENANYSQYFGGDDETIDSLNPGESMPRSFRDLRTAVRSRDEDKWGEIVKLMDVDSYIDFYLAQNFGPNSDLKTGGNWRAAGGGSAGRLWRFYCWDTERVLESVRSRGNPSPSQDGAEFISSLDDIEEFQIRLGDRLQKHLSPGGALTTEKCRARWEKYMVMLDLPIICESARWGDERRSSRPYTRDNEWIKEVEKVRDTFFPLEEPNRTSYYREKWEREEWRGTDISKYVAGPEFMIDGESSYGGVVQDGQKLGFDGSEGTVYYTLDGTDPRVSATVGDPEILLEERVPATAFIPTDDSLGDNWQQPGFDDASWIQGETGVGYQYDDLTGIDAKSMQGVNGSIYIRVPFAIADQAALDEIGSIALNMKYEDGFVAYINGVQVASMNAPNPLLWNSLATKSNSDSNAKVFEEFDAASGVGALQVGENVLAIQLMNSIIGGSDVLGLPQMTFKSASSAGLSPDAILYKEPIDLARSRTVTARKFTGDGWSAVSTALFIAEPLAGPGDVVISEIDFHPADPTREEFAAGLALHPLFTLGDDDFEFGEVYNPGNKAVNLFGMSFVDGVSMVFDSYVLEPGARAVVVRDFAAFSVRYGTNVPVAGEYLGSFSNKGESVSVLAADGTSLAAFEFDDKTPWPDTADGGGPSLHFTDPAKDPANGVNWTASTPTPGTGDEPSGGENYDSWAILIFGQNAGTLGLASADPDGDDVENLVEFALRMNPMIADPAGLPQAGTSGGSLTMTYLQNPTAAGITWQAQMSTDLVQWNNVASESIGNDLYRAGAGIPNAGEVYLRLKVSR